ncbi:uncharacterized protein LOC111709877 isoform X2 [Eurytemora carolleeae]|uniref:uncharacterized protein LOC111709877 isoform X2 n=1 Tax=Eurytemora carolleeae TaxID=1294199 RepID=UPI000C769C30|nr:uncharacterized protein LOC111709877 isoform X2 [Eurytemora carolleeae]|eukprot:XP_023339575.1 uncharacterized protein LOC111709877 isoform X2 [Eurytemora affinis]
MKIFLLILSLVERAVFLPPEFKSSCISGCTVPIDIEIQEGLKLENVVRRTEAVSKRLQLRGSTLSQLLDSPMLSTISAAVQSTGFMQNLNSPPYTIFFPQNSGFQKMNSSVLSEMIEDGSISIILLRHIVPGNFKSRDIPLGITKVKTIGTEVLELIRAGNCVSLRTEHGSANVVLPDHEFDTGILHLVDSLI